MKNEEKIRGNFVASAPPNTNIACLSPGDPFLDKLKGLLYGWKMEMEAVMTPYKV